VAVASLGCSDAVSPASSLVVRATFDRTQVRSGESITAAADIENSGATALTISSSMASSIEVRDARNRVVFFGQSGAFTMAAVAYPPRLLEPGQRIAETAAWGTELVGAVGGPAPPGVYRLRVAVAVLGRKVRYAYSTPVEVTVLPP
jgi:hypothetical protein